jgi:hypothetical protein
MTSLKLTFRQTEETMASKKNDDDQEKSFVVRDRRFSAQKEEEQNSQAKPEAREEEAPPGETEQDQKTALPEISFANLIFSLSTSALIQLGEIKDPATQEAEKNLPLAKQTIDLIGLLQEKTKGNLTPEEGQLMENVLYDLRMRYVKATA